MPLKVECVSHWNLRGSEKGLRACCVYLSKRHMDQYFCQLTCNPRIYTKKLLNSDWLRKECKMCNTSAKCVIQWKLHIAILDYNWLMINRVWLGPMKSFVCSA